MIRVFILLSLLLIGFNLKAETCKECMSKCPHQTMDLKSCDLGCPKVCGSNSQDGSDKLMKCEQCMSDCPHETRDFKSCDGGCPEACDRESLVQILLKTKFELNGCNSDRVPSSVKAKNNKK